MTRVRMFGIAAALSGALVLGGVHPAAAQVHVGVGVSVSLPAGHAWVEFGGARYAYYDGGFYRPYRMGRFVRVAPPIGAVLTWIPEYARLCYYDGYQYFVYDGVWYMPEYMDDGTLVYVVVEAPYGVGVAPYRVYYYPRPYVVRPVRFSGVFLGLFFRDRYVDRDRYYRDRDHYYRGRDRYGRYHYVSRGRNSDGYGNRDPRANTRARVQVPAVRVRPQPRPAPGQQIRRAQPQARPAPGQQVRRAPPRARVAPGQQVRRAQPQVRRAQPQARRAQPQVRRAQPQVRRAQPQVRRAQPQARRTQPQARRAQPQVRRTQPRARPAPAARSRAKPRAAPRRSRPASHSRGHGNNGHHGGGS
jgi:hypothetical protein